MSRRNSPQTGLRRVPRRWRALSSLMVLVIVAAVVGTDLFHASVYPALTATPQPRTQASLGTTQLADTSQAATSVPASIPMQDADYIWTEPPSINANAIPPDLQKQLAHQVDQMTQAGHLAPLALIGGIGFASGSYSWDRGGAKYQPYTLAWLNPADAITALSQAYPLLPPAQQASLRAYLRAELDTYPIDTFAIGGAYTLAKPNDGSPYYRGVRRERFAIPTDVTYNLWPPLGPPIDNLYGLWAYANATGDWAYVQGRWDRVLTLSQAAIARGTPDSYGQIGGLIGFARIARKLGHEPEAQAAADLAIRGLRAGTDFAAFVKTADQRRPNSHAVTYSVFSYLTPEVGAYLRTHAHDAVAAYVADATSTANLPTWYLAWTPQTLGGENAFLNPEVAWQLFLTEAYTLDQSARNLRRALDQPWAVGDPYFIQKLVATIRTEATPAAKTTATTTEQVARTVPRGADPPRIQNVTDNRSSFPIGQPPVGERFELTFAVAGGTWTNPMIPYDAHPPPGVPGETGITVNALLTAPDGTTITQPGFLYQGYTRSERGSQEILTPDDSPQWKVRIAFPHSGEWSYRLLVADATGEAVFPTNDTWKVTVAPAISHGFIHVSPADARYFAYDDGTTFNPMGYNEGFSRSQFTQDVDAKLAQWRGSGINLLRLWMSGSNLTGASWLPWRSMSLPGDGYLPATGLVADHPDAATPFVFQLNAANRCMAYGIDEGLAIQAGHTYQLTVRVRTEGVTDGGFTAQLASWLGPQCGTDTVAHPLVPPVTGTTDWQTIRTMVTLPNGSDPPPYLYLTLARGAGAAYISSVALHDIAGDSSAADLIARSPDTVLGGTDLAAAWQWDYALDAMQTQGISAKLVLLEKNDWAFNHLGRDGKPVSDAPPGNTNFYAPQGTAANTYEEYYWRMVIARWGAFRSVQSWELLNEGDPDSPDHLALATDFARYMHANDTEHHPVTTSFWAGFPLAFFQNAGLDYADIHQYEDTSKPRPPWALPAPATLDRNPADANNGHGTSVRLAAGVSGNDDHATIALHGKGTWTIHVDIRAQNLVGACPYNAPANLAGPQLTWQLDTGIYAGSENRGRGIVPPAPSNQAFVCSSPAGTYDWRSVTGTFVLDDDAVHTLAMSFRTSFATSGTAWFDNVTVTAPDGRLLPIFGDGTFNDATSPTADLAVSTAVLGQRYGAQSPAGAGMPLMRGETGLSPENAGVKEDPRLLQDHDGVWLHTLLWAQLASGGAMNLPWYTTSINANTLWRLYAPYGAFIARIPLAAGGYVDAAATASDAAIRVLGQRNMKTNNAYLWIRNAGFTWQNAVTGTSSPPVAGTVSLRLAPGTYHVEWWDTTTGVISWTNTTATSPDGTLMLTLPRGVQNDIALQVSPA